MNLHLLLNNSFVVLCIITSSQQSVGLASINFNKFCKQNSPNKYYYKLNILIFPGGSKEKPLQGDSPARTDGRSSSTADTPTQAEGQSSSTADSPTQAEDLSSSTADTETTIGFPDTAGLRSEATG